MPLPDRLTAGRHRTTSQAPGFRLMESPKQPGYEKNHQDGAKSDARAAAVTPTAVPVVPSATAQKKQQNDQYYQHGESLLLLNNPLNLANLLLDFSNHLFRLALSL